MAVTVGHIAQLIEKLAPKAWAEDWDNVGLLVGNNANQVQRILVALDGTAEVVEEAEKLGAQLILAHHPIIFRPLKNLRADNPSAQVPIRLVEKGISYYAAHTNLDQSDFSSSWTLGKYLGLEDMQLLAPNPGEKMVKLAVFVPVTDVETVRQALVKIGVGESVTDGPHSAFYSEVFFQSQGEGMFRPLSGANPALGEVGTLTKVREAKLESILPVKLVERAIRALKKVHPYEEPAYDIIPLSNSGKKRGYGIMGYLPETEKLEHLWQRLLSMIEKNEEHIYAQKYRTTGIRLAGDGQKPVKKVAIVNGSGSSFISKALFQGVDFFISGDIDHHAALDALAGDMAVGDLGHFLSEAPMLMTLANYLRAEKALQGVEILISSVNNVPWFK